MGEGEHAARRWQTSAFASPCDCIISLSHPMGEGQGEGQRLRSQSAGQSYCIEGKQPLVNSHISKPRQFASDNYAGICPEALAAMLEANREHDVSYGDDAWTAK